MSADKDWAPVDGPVAPVDHGMHEFACLACAREQAREFFAAEADDGTGFFWNAWDERADYAARERYAVRAVAIAATAFVLGLAFAALIDLVAGWWVQPAADLLV